MKIMIIEKRKNLNILLFKYLCSRVFLPLKQKGRFRMDCF